MDYLERALEIQDEIIANRRHLHENAEVGCNLPKTVEFVMEKLTEMGYEPVEICKGGVLATVGKGGKTFLIRSDMDALPMNEESGLPFCSKDLAAHTCGHDLHTAILLGTAKLLKERESELQGTVKLMFQPGEEIFKGAGDMIEAGIMDNPKVDCALSSHVFTGKGYNTISIIKGPAMASCNGFKITITGKGCHGAQPQNGIDPINIGVHIHTALQEIISREVEFTNGALITIGKFVSGTAANIIPSTAELQGTIRTFNEDIRERLVERMKTIATLTAEKFRGTAEIEILSDVPVTINDPDFTDTIVDYINDFSKGRIEILDADRLTGSEDFGRVAKLVPSLMYFLGATDMESDEEVFPAHHPKIKFDERCLVNGAAVFAECADRWLREHK